MNYITKIKISQKFADYANKCLQRHILDEDETHAKTAVFPNGCQMDIKLCGAHEEPAWTESALYDEEGCELCRSDVSDEFIGEWHIVYENNSYTVIVDVEKHEDESIKESMLYIALISGEYVRNAEVFDSSYDEEDMEGYIYDDSHWQDASGADIFIGMFNCVNLANNKETLQKLREIAVDTAIENGICEQLSAEAIKLIEI